MNKVLVTGGCGYIGSHTIVDLIENGFEVISVDSLVNAEESSLDGVKAITGKKIKNYAVDLCDLEKTKQIFQENPDIKGIIHFAALKSVGESVEQPLRYFRNNLFSLLNILDCMNQFNTEHLIFSSSCSVYGNAEALPVTESTLFRRQSPHMHVPNKWANRLLLTHSTSLINLVQYCFDILILPARTKVP